MIPQELYKLCNEFNKLAELSGVSVAKNADPLLKKISELSSFDDRVALAEKYFDKLGVGSSRTIFKIPSDLVLKVAHNDKGLVQNFAEMKPEMQKPCTNPVLAADVKGKWIIVKFTEDVTKEKFKKFVGFTFDSFMEALFYKFNNESDKWTQPSNYDEILESGLFKCMVKLVVDCDLQIGDIDKPSSWGILNGKVVLRDYGLTREVFQEYYADSDSSSSSSSTTKTSS